MTRHRRHGSALLLAAAVAVLPAIGLAQDGARTTVPVPRITIYPGDVIRDAMLAEAVLRPAARQAGGFHASQATLVGRVARRTLIAGHPIPIDTVRAPFAIQQGAIVLLELEMDGLYMSAQGEAMQPGSVGEIVNMRNLDTGAIIRARVRDERSAAVEDR